MADSEEQFTRDETLLYEGKYREWFYKGLERCQLDYLRQPPRMPQIPVKDEPTVLNGWFDSQPVWQHKASCIDAGPVVFFSEGQNIKEDYLDPGAKWREYCPTCPVREACLQAARDSASVGIWGGKLFFREQSGSSRVINEYDETNIVLRGRPRKVR